MRSTTSPHRPLATAHDLAAYHARRERFYAALALLLGGTPDDKDLSTVRHVLQRDAGDVGPLWPALASATASGVEAELADLFPTRATPDARRVDARTAVGGDARAAAGCASRLGAVADLRLLAALADQTAHALDGGDIPSASSLTDVQGRFLRDHASACVTDLAAELVGSGRPFCAALGRSLAEQIGEDVRLLATAEEIPA